MSSFGLTAVGLAELCVCGGRMEDCPPGTLTSLPFAEILAQAIAEGRVSVRRAAGLVSLTIEDLADLFRRNGIEVPFDV